MAVVGSATKLFEGESATRGENTQDYAPSYLVEVDDAETTLTQILAASGLPSVGGIYSVGGRIVICKAVAPVRMPGTRLLWRVDVRYETADNQKADGQKLTTGGDLSDNPDQWMPQFEIDSVPAMQPIERAVFLGTSDAGSEDFANLGNTTLGGLIPNGSAQATALINSAGTTFDPPLEQEEYWPVLRITSYSPGFNSTLAAEYENSINSDPWTFTRPGYTRTFGRYQTRLGPIKARLGFHRKQDGTGLYFYTVSYELYVNPLGWIQRVIDRGFERKDTRSTTTGQVKRTRIKDPDNSPIAEPHLLDGSGQPLSPGGSPVVLHYRTLKIKDYNNLAL